MKKSRQYLIDIFKIALPVIVGNIGHVFIGITDVFIAARHSVNALASIAIANSFLFTVLIFGIGLLTGISILLSNKRGEKSETKQYLPSSILLSQIISFFSFIAIIAIGLLIPLLGFDESIVKDIQQYIYITAFSVFGMFLYQAIKEFLQAHEIVMFPNIILICAVFLNLIFNYIFVFGYGSIPAMGVIGIAYATLIVRCFLGLVMLFDVWKIVRQQDKKQRFDFAYMKEVLRLGLPVGIGLVFECLGFNIITVFLGKDSAVLAAAHNILSTLVETTFMVPLAISSAIAIKVGFYNGEKNVSEIKNYGKVGVLACLIFMMFCSLSFLLTPEFFIGIFTKDAEIMMISVPIVMMFSVFEIADGLQISLGGILKGLKLTKQVTISSLTSYWLVGLPIGFYTAYGLGMSIKGFWIGITISLFLVAFLEFVIILLSLKKIKKEC